MSVRSHSSGFPAKISRYSATNWNTTEVNNNLLLNGVKLVSRVHLILHHVLEHIGGVDRWSRGKLAETVSLFESHPSVVTVGQWVIRTRLWKNGNEFRTNALADLVLNVTNIKERNTSDPYLFVLEPVLQILVTEAGDVTHILCGQPGDHGREVVHKGQLDELRCCR